MSRFYVVNILITFSSKTLTSDTFIVDTGVKPIVEYIEDFLNQEHFMSYTLLTRDSETGADIHSYFYEAYSGSGKKSRVYVKLCPIEVSIKRSIRITERG